MPQTIGFSFLRVAYLRTILAPSAPFSCTHLARKVIVSAVLTRDISDHLNIYISLRHGAANLSIWIKHWRSTMVWPIWIALLPHRHSVYIDFFRLDSGIAADRRLSWESIYLIPVIQFVLITASYLSFILTADFWQLYLNVLVWVNVKLIASRDLVRLLLWQPLVLWLIYVLKVDHLGLEGRRLRRKQGIVLHWYRRSFCILLNVLEDRTSCYI